MNNNLGKLAANGIRSFRAIQLHATAELKTSYVFKAWPCIIILNLDYHQVETCNRITELVSEITASHCLWHAIRQLFHSSCARYLSLNCLNGFVSRQILISILPGLNAFVIETKRIGNDRKTEQNDSRSVLSTNCAGNNTNTYLGETSLM